MNNSEEGRYYAPVWKLLKTPPHSVVLEVHPSLVARVRKAVSKEKYNDIAFKELTGHKDVDYFYLKFVYTVAEQQLKIELVNRFGIDFPQEG